MLIINRSKYLQILFYEKEGHPMEKKDFLSLISSGGNQLQSVIKCNEYTRQFGVTLTEVEARQLLDARKQSLHENGRVEFGEGILSKLIFTFCDSPFIYQDNYVDTMEALQDIFYLYKNESLDVLSDDELIEYMKNEFDGTCQGSLEYLEDTSLERFARQIRRSGHGFF